MWAYKKNLNQLYKHTHTFILNNVLYQKYDFMMDSEQEKVKSYRQKISKWQGQVSDRLQVLSRRAGLLVSFLSYVIVIFNFTEYGVNCVLTLGFISFTWQVGKQ